MGRPFKYKSIVLLLNPKTLYSAASIATFASEKGLLPGQHEHTLRRSYTRVRITLGRFSRAYGFPRNGDGLVYLPGQPSYPGWYGWRWQEAMKK